MLPGFDTFQISLDRHIAHIEFNRPHKANSMNQKFWDEIPQVFNWVDTTDEVRVAIFSGIGKHFCAGLDLSMFGSLAGSTETTPSDDKPCAARNSETLRLSILRMQDSLSAIEKCRKPVLAAIHGACVGGGIDLITCCDMRYSTVDARFCIKEIDIGMVADVGTLQRLPKLIGDGMVRELSYTGRFWSGKEAVDMGLVNQAFHDKESMLTAVMDIAATIASKSPLSIRGTKQIILYTRDHNVSDSLDYIATWNAGMLMSDDLNEALTATSEGREPIFKN